MRSEIDDAVIEDDFDEDVLPDVVRDAEEAIAALADSFVEWTIESLDTAGAAVAEALSAPGANQDHVRRVFAIAHDMKGQGGAFDYPLVTSIAGMLCEYVRDTVETLETRHLKVIEAHLSALRFVLEHTVTGTGGEVGRRLEDKLRQVTGEAGQPL